MVTKNWYYVMKAYRAQKTLTGVITDTGGYKDDCSYYASDTILLTMALRANSGLSFYYAYSNYNSYIVLGRGRTPATVNDYKLENMITSGLSATVSNSVDENGDCTQKLVITNTSSGDITIGEIGLSAPFYRSTISSDRGMALMDRTVLDEPVTIPAGGIGMIDYTIKIPIPTA